MPKLLVPRQRTVSALATPLGCCNFFDRCGDGDLLSLHYAGQLPLLDWMGFNVSDQCYRTVQFITYNRPAYYQGSPTAGYIADACATPNGIEYGSAKVTVEDFGRIGRLGPTRDIMKPLKYCLNDPRWSLDGRPVTDEQEWDMVFIGDQIIADLSKLLVTGSDATPGQFDGLEQWVSTGYQSGMLDSIVIDWNGNDMGGGAGITWNGAAVAATANIVDVLLAAYRRIKQRISWAPRLNVQPIGIGDMILVMPTHVVQCLLDYFTCWSVCDGSQYNEVALQSYEARNFRNGLLGGMFGFGQITLDGQIIPIMAYDWELIKTPHNSDMYFLTGGIGAVKIWEGEHLDAGVAASKFGDSGYFESDGGRMLWTTTLANECVELKGWIHPRLFCKAPWAQVRFQDVKCDAIGPIISPDPTATSFYPVTSFGGDAAECP